MVMAVREWQQIYFWKEKGTTLQYSDHIHMPLNFSFINSYNAEARERCPMDTLTPYIPPDAPLFPVKFISLYTLPVT